MFHYYKNVLLGNLFTLDRVKLADLFRCWVDHVVNFGQEVVGLAIVFEKSHYLDFSQDLDTVVLTMREIRNELDSNLSVGQKALSEHDIAK